MTDAGTAPVVDEGSAHRSGPAPPSRTEVFRRFLAEKRDPFPYYEALAARTVADLPVDVAGACVLDLGCGTGHNSRALRAAGATVVGLDLDALCARETAGHAVVSVAADGMYLPFAEGCFDVVFCSNMLEHAPDPWLVLDEINRVLRPGGWAWVSFTNWWSPWGGHAIVPFHLLGPRLGPRAWRALFGDPRKNVPYEGLFPTYVGRTLTHLAAHPGLDLTDAMPRYYPRQRWVLRVPVLREVLTWNCAMVLRRHTTVTPATTSTVAT